MRAFIQLHLLLIPTYISNILRGSVICLSRNKHGVLSGVIYWVITHVVRMIWVFLAVWTFVTLDYNITRLCMLESKILTTQSTQRFYPAMLLSLPLSVSAQVEDRHQQPYWAIPCFLQGWEGLATTKLQRLPKSHRAVNLLNILDSSVIISSGFESFAKGNMTVQY
jgi:hypothetical protein